MEFALRSCPHRVKRGYLKTSEVAFLPQNYTAPRHALPYADQLIASV
jgi:hypothetical protein